MSMIPKILAFAGSARQESYNKKLVKIASAGAQEAGAEVTLVDLRDYPMPLVDEDLEKLEGIPANARKIKELMMAHHGLLISSPEYNSSITPLLKNTIDWVSRSISAKEASLSAYQGKVAAIMSASPGALGGLRSLSTVRSLLENIGVMVIPDQRAISKAHEAFNPDGNLKDPKLAEGVKSLGAKLVQIIRKLNA